MKSTALTLMFWASFLLLGNAQGPADSSPQVVGFSSQLEIDYSRPSTKTGELGRLIQINLWYPAQRGQTASSMHFSDYLRIKHDEMGAGKSAHSYQQTVASYFQWPVSQGADTSLLDSIATDRGHMKAGKELEFAPGKHPVILLMHGSAVDFAFLGESLAEAGYVAINVPIQGYRQQELDVNGIGMETEIRDYEFALSVLSQHNNLLLKDMAVLGFSFGGQSAVGLACRNPFIKSVISYDGGIGDRFGTRLINEDPFCGIENVSASILHIYDASYPQTYLDKIRSFVHASRTLVGLEGIAHWHFTSFGALAGRIPGLFGKKEFATDGYETIWAITKSFLQSHSKNTATPFDVPKKEFDLIQSVEQFDPIPTK